MLQKGLSIHAWPCCLSWCFLFLPDTATWATSEGVRVRAPYYWQHSTTNRVALPQSSHFPNPFVATFSRLCIKILCAALYTQERLLQPQLTQKHFASKTPRLLIPVASGCGFSPSQLQAAMMHRRNASQAGPRALGLFSGGHQLAW